MLLIARSSRTPKERGYLKTHLKTDIWNSFEKTQKENDKSVLEY